jgi:hypothetical protein
LLEVLSLILLSINRNPLTNLTDMIKLVNSELELYDQEERRALHQLGNYRFIPGVEGEKFLGKLPTDKEWQKMSKVEKEALVLRYKKLRFQRQPKRKPVEVKEEEEEEEVVVVSQKKYTYKIDDHKKGTAKKPGQMVRAAVQRTRSFKRTALRSPSPDEVVSKPARKKRHEEEEEEEEEEEYEERADVTLPRKYEYEDGGEDDESGSVSDSY